MLIFNLLFLNNFIWLATDNGLYKYDGYEYKNVKPPISKPSSLFNFKLDNNKVLHCHDLPPGVYQCVQFPFVLHQLQTIHFYLYKGRKLL